jgi:hypothetical protein
MPGLVAHRTDEISTQRRWPSRAIAFLDAVVLPPAGEDFVEITAFQAQVVGWVKSKFICRKVLAS